MGLDEAAEAGSADLVTRSSRRMQLATVAVVAGVTGVLAGLLLAPVRGPEGANDGAPAGNDGTPVADDTVPARRLAVDSETLQWAEATVVGMNTCARFRRLTGGFDGWFEPRMADVAFAGLRFDGSGRIVVSAPMESVIRGRGDASMARWLLDAALFRDCYSYERERYSLSIRAVAEETGRLIATSDSIGHVTLCAEGASRCR